MVMIFQAFLNQTHNHFTYCKAYAINDNISTFQHYIEKMAFVNLHVVLSLFRTENLEILEKRKKL